MTRLVTALALVLSLPLAAAGGAAAQSGDDIEVTVEPGSLQIDVGEEVELTVTVRNTVDAPSPELAVHLDITSPTERGSVDPEDWTGTLTSQIGALEPGESRNLRWTVKPISSGAFTLYAVALPKEGTPEVWPSNGVRIDVEARRTLNPEGVLPVAIAAPVLVGGLLLTRLRRPGRR